MASYYRIQLTVDANEVIDTEQHLPRNTYNNVPVRDMYVTQFTGDGTLEQSEDKTNWLDTEKGATDALEIYDSWMRYVRITGTGTKTITLYAL